MKKKFTLSLIFILSFFAGFSQDYAIGKRTINFVDESRNNRQISTDVYYPADADGNDVAVAQGTQKFPVVVFGHGFLITPSAYSWLADSVVKKGYIVAFPSTEGGILPSHSNFGEDLAFLCATITQLNDSASSFLYNRVIKKAAVAGHSMGGGCSFLAASGGSSSINAIFNFAAAETNPSAVAAALSVNIPALVFTGTSDCIVDDAVPQSMYENVPYTCKTFIDITDALHCQYANNNGVCVLGQVTTGCNSSSITPAIVFDKVTTLLIPFLDYYLKGNCTSGIDYLSAFDAITGVIKMHTCNSFTTCVLPVVVTDFTGQNNNDVISLFWHTATESNFRKFIVEKSFDGKTFSPVAEVPAKGIGYNYIATDKFPYPGFSYYRLKLVNTDGRYSYSSILKLKTGEKNLAITRYFPNPVNDILHLEIISGTSQKISISIYNMLGKKIMQKDIILNAGNNNKDLLLDKISAGSYILRCSDDKEKVVSTLSLIKAGDN